MWVKIYLDEDIDMTSADFTPIGSNDHPFNGTFDGQGHRIKNLTINNTTGYTGLFGYIGGYDAETTTTIENVIIDSSCTITSTGTGVAGLVGCVTSTSGKACKVTIQNCGNEATITGNKNVAGILGGVYINDYTYLWILNSFNTGAINGTEESAAICGYARKNYSINNCYNSGSVTGGTDTYSFFRFTNESTAMKIVNNCYDVNGSQTSVSKITSDHVRCGYLCQQLNANHGSYSAWQQDLENDVHPIFGTEGITYTRSMANQWGTIVVPFDVTIDSSEPYDFYQLSDVSGSTLTLTKMTGTLSAGTPAIIRMSEASKSNGKYELSLPAGTLSTTINTPDAVGDLTLTGAYTSTDITDKDGYIIANNTFWNIADIKGENKVYCSPFRAWLAGSIESDAKQLTIGFDDDTPTAVETLNAITSGTAEYYNLNGHKLNDLQQGVNIMKFKNGITKKVVIK